MERKPDRLTEQHLQYFVSRLDGTPELNDKLRAQAVSEMLATPGERRELIARDAIAPSSAPTGQKGSRRRLAMAAVLVAFLLIALYNIRQHRLGIEYRTRIAVLESVAADAAKKLEDLGSLDRHLLASVQLRFRQDRSLPQAATEAALDLIIESPRTGFASIVLLQSTQYEVYPPSDSDQHSIELEAFHAREYGPIRSPRDAMLVVITQIPASEQLRQLLDEYEWPETRLNKESLDGLVEHLRSELYAAGHAWTVTFDALLDDSQNE